MPHAACEVGDCGLSTLWPTWLWQWPCVSNGETKRVIGGATIWICHWYPTKCHEKCLKITTVAEMFQGFSPFVAGLLGGGAVREMVINCKPCLGPDASWHHLATRLRPVRTFLVLKLLWPQLRDAELEIPTDPCELVTMITIHLGMYEVIFADIY